MIGDRSNILEIHKMGDDLYLVCRYTLAMMGEGSPPVGCETSLVTQEALMRYLQPGRNDKE